MGRKRRSSGAAADGAVEGSDSTATTSTTSLQSVAVATAAAELTPRAMLGFFTDEELREQLRVQSTSELETQLAIEMDTLRILEAAHLGDGGPGTAAGARGELLQCLTGIPGSVDELLSQILTPARSIEETRALPQVVMHQPHTMQANGRGPTDQKIAQLELYLQALLVFEPDALSIISDALQEVGRSNLARVPKLTLKEISKWCKLTAEKRPSTYLKKVPVIDRIRRVFASIQTVDFELSCLWLPFERVTTYTYGRYYLTPSLLHRIAERMTRFLMPCDVYVDFSAGTNEFGALLEQAAGIQRWLGIDIFPPRFNACHRHFRQMSWFDVHSLPPRTVIGLSPPFGIGAETASLFIMHALGFAPRLLALVVPDRTAAMIQLVQLSNDWIAAARALSRSGGEFASADWRQLTERPAERMRLLSLPARLPDYLVVDADNTISSSDAFYAPGTKGSLARLNKARNGVPPVAEGLSGDLTPAATKKPGGMRDGDAPRGLSVYPEGDSAPSWFLFCSALDILSPTQVVEVTWLSDYASSPAAGQYSGGRR